MIPALSTTPRTPLDWVSQLERHANTKPDEVAITYVGSESLTWLELRERVSRLAASLRGLGVSRGGRVGMVQSNEPGYLESLLAIHRLGAIAVPINFRLSASEIAYILSDCSATVALTDATLHAKTQEAAATASVTVGVEDVRKLLADARTEDTIDHGGAPEPASADEAVLIVYTSGTTGKPKGAVLSRENMIAQTISYLQVFSSTRDGDVSLISTPLFHIAALGAVLPNLVVGHTTIVLPSGAFDAETFLDTVEQHGVTSAFLVPTQWQDVCASPTLPQRNLPLRAIAWAAAPASLSLLRRMIQSFPGVDIVSTFGQTEMSPNTTVLRGEDATRKIGSVGKALPLVDLRIVDTEMRDVPTGEVGEIVYRGPNAMLGYWNRPKETAEAFAGGWFHSGDLVRRDEEGFIYVVDRLKDMIISGGENIYSAEIETVIAEDPRVEAVAVIGEPHARWGEVPLAIVTAGDGSNPPVAEKILELCRERLARYKCPARVLIVDELPRNATGKILKNVLRESIP
ncbi:AMP-binding protein [[Mycobacterium] burgundiense]|uniref:AMP-binding protein n=1 Tax=[Mycobacterium] burgundiense TaxID=3064286 RepID=A0ABM9LE62_9MYCO|nr:AMP-binding protein [Mycolicibacterium sp. MU0053]CAJ1497538.1 AMP-binding protein [Mycolicibacterium sp. MU0053]